MGEEIFSDAGTQGTAEDLLDSQIVTLRERRAYIFLIRELANRFSSVSVIAEKSISLKETTSQLTNRLEKMLGDLVALHTRILEFRGFLNGFDLVEDEDGRWESVEDIFDARWEELEKSVERIHSGLVTHANLTSLKNEMEVRKAEFVRLVSFLVDFRSAFANEHYLVCEAILDNDEFDKRLLQTTSLYDTYRVDDVVVSRGRSIIGWDNVSRVTRERAGYLRTIRQWGIRFAMPEDVSNTPEDYSEDKLPVSEQVVNWTKEKETVGRLMKEGRVSDADDYLNSIIGDAGAQHQGKMSLEKAIFELNRVPLARRGDGKFGDYQTGIHEAGIPIGQRLIQWMQRYRLEYYTGWRDEALSMKKSIRSDAERWKQELTEFMDAVKKLEGLLENKTFWGKVKDVEAVRKQVERAGLALAQMERISPNHIELEAYKSNKFYLKALEV